jgi:hypothetical protein
MGGAFQVGDKVQTTEELETLLGPDMAPGTYVYATVPAGSIGVVEGVGLMQDWSDCAYFSVYEVRVEGGILVSGGAREFSCV